MRIAYLDCASGISGDMTLAALIDAGVDLAAIQSGIESLGLAEVRLSTSDVKRKGFRANYLTIEHPPEHAHRHLHHITDMIDKSRLTERQRELATKIFTRIGEAEAKAHGTTIRKVHFHEVGAIDSIADICGAAIAFDLLGVDKVVASPVPTGTGFIEIAHGRCSIPAPATAELLIGIPLAASRVEAELTTPTGAAIVATLASEFGPLPAMTIERIGYGAGTRELAEQPNILRVLVGTATGGTGSEQLWQLETNLDDSSGELIGYTIGRLWEAGALDVWTTGITMKKQRPGVLLSVLTTADKIEALEGILFAETTTLGVRRWATDRRKLTRTAHRVATAWGEIAGTLALLPSGQQAFAPEFEACRVVAAAQGVPLREVVQAALAAYRSGG